MRAIHRGRGPKIFTIGYERRSASELTGALADAGVQCVIDVRQRPQSRRAQFGAKALSSLCAAAGIEYQGWQRLGSTDLQRRRLKQTGDFASFRRLFRAMLLRSRGQELAALVRLARKRRLALLCYERRHEECHRSIITRLLAARFDAAVIAIE